jgi:hypothetical protein
LYDPIELVPATPRRNARKRRQSPPLRHSLAWKSAAVS